MTFDQLKQEVKELDAVQFTELVRFMSEMASDVYLDSEFKDQAWLKARIDLESAVEELEQRSSN